MLYVDKQTLKILFWINLFVCEHRYAMYGALVYRSVHVAVKKTACWSPFSPSIVRAWVLNSGCQASQQAPFLAESSIRLTCLC